MVPAGGEALRLRHHRRRSEDPTRALGPCPSKGKAVAIPAPTKSSAHPVGGRERGPDCPLGRRFLRDALDGRRGPARPGRPSEPVRVWVGVRRRRRPGLRSRRWDGGPPPFRAPWSDTRSSPSMPAQPIAGHLVRGLGVPAAQPPHHQHRVHLPAVRRNTRARPLAGTVARRGHHRQDAASGRTADSPPVGRPAGVDACPGGRRPPLPALDAAASFVISLVT